MTSRSRASASGEFRRRSALYAGLDAQLVDRTRFFAAAALINAAFARLFILLPVARVRDSFLFLKEVGAHLEKDNVGYAREILEGPSGGVLDRALVQAEQGALQRYVREQQCRQPRRWQVIQRQLNGLLNDRLVTSLWRPCDASYLVVQALRQARGRLGRELDFATEADRVWIGLMLIERIRGGASSGVMEIRGGA